MLDGPDIPLPQVCGQFIAMDKNKEHLSKFLPEVIVDKGQTLSDQYELIAVGGFPAAIQ